MIGAGDGAGGAGGAGTMIEDCAAYRCTDPHLPGLEYCLEHLGSDRGPCKTHRPVRKFTAVICERCGAGPTHITTLPPLTGNVGAWPPTEDTQ